MNTIVTVELVCAVFLAVQLLVQVRERGRSGSGKFLNLSIVLLLFVLIVDVMAYVFMDDSTPFAFRYAVCLLAYAGEGIYFIGFAYYSEAYFSERTQISPWLFRTVRLAELVWIVLTAAIFISGKIVIFENGVEVADNGYPTWLSVYQIIVMLYTPVAAFIYRKKIGREAVILLSFFNITPIIGIIASVFIYYDYSYVLGSITLVFIADMLQRRQSLEQQAELAGHEAMEENSARFFALEDDFEVLYDVEMETGRYDIFVKGQTFGDVNRNLINNNSFFDDVEKNLDVVYPEDRQGNYDTTRPEFIRGALSKEDHFDRYYRLLVDGEPAWARMRIVWKNSEHKNIIIGVFDAQEEMRAKEEEAERLRAKELELSHSEFRAASLAYLTENEGDIRSFLNFFAGRLRELIGCDQVIYRDERGEMFTDNTPELGENFSIPREICRNCSHYDIFSPAYEKGGVEIPDTAACDKNFPVHRDCPVKSSLTRIVYLDGKVSGYLAIHYILDHHEFSDYERQTLEEFAHLLSISLSRHAARTKNEQLEQELELKSQIEEQNRQLEEQRKQLEEARNAADAANQSKSNFLFNMSHDIRTPMNAIKGFTAMAKKNADNPDKVNEYLDKIDISGQQLLTLINQVLEMARIESGKAVLNEKPVSIREEFNSMVTVLSEQAEAKGLKFRYELRDIVHNFLLVDEARLNSMALNITGNAMKYTPEGGSIDFIFRELPCSRPGYATFVFTVSDTGIGMSEEYLKELYVPFSREKNSTVSRIQGTGLGMSIVKSTIDMMGGNIEVSSAPGRGTRFDITIDFRISEDGETAAEVSESIGRMNLAGRRVLLVEDNEMNREIAKDILEEQGLTVEEAEDGDIALAMVQVIADRGEYDYYDFILMDVQMPRMNGYDATRAIRAIPAPEGVHVPIIAMTANAFEEDRRNALAAGMDEHLAKPIDVQTMFRTIAKFL